MYEFEIFEFLAFDHDDFLCIQRHFIQNSSAEAVMPEYLPVNRAVSRNDAIKNE